MSYLLLVLATAFWLIAAVPGFQIPFLSGRVDFEALGLFCFGVWLLIGGAERLRALVHRPQPPS